MDQVGLENIMKNTDTVCYSFSYKQRKEKKAL